MHSSRMRTTRALPYGGLCPGVNLTETPLQRPPTPQTETPLTEIHLDKDPQKRPLGQRPPLLGQRLPWDRDSPGTETPPDRDPPGQRPPDRDPHGQRSLDRDPSDRDPLLTLYSPDRGPPDRPPRQRPLDRDPLG